MEDESGGREKALYFKGTFTALVRRDREEDVWGRGLYNNRLELKSVRRDASVRFELAYEQYLRQIIEDNRGRTATQRNSPAGAKACVAPDLLRSLTMLKTFANIDDISQVTDDMVLQWIRLRTGCSSDDMHFMPRKVKEALLRVKFKPDRSDPQGVALQFFLQMWLRRSRLQNAIEDAAKAVITLLIPKLEPSVLRETIQNARVLARGGQVRLPKLHAAGNEGRRRLLQVFEEARER